MEITFQQYIDNPLGKQNAVFSQRDLFRELYTKKCDQLLLREAGIFPTFLFIEKKKSGSRYFCYVKVPSEEVKDFYYDTVIEFYPTEALHDTATVLDNYRVRFFSNDPAFIYTYGYVFFNKADLLIRELKPKVSKQALNTNPQKKNPYEIPGYVKSIYFAFLYMKAKGYFNKAIYDEYAKPFSIRMLLAMVEHSDKKIADRQEKGMAIRRQRAAEKRKQLQADISNQQARHTQRLPTNLQVKKTKTAPSTQQKAKSVRQTKVVDRSSVVKGPKLSNRK